MEDSVQTAAPPGSRFWHRTRPWPWIAILLALGLLVLAVPISRRHLLRATGWALVGPDPHVHSADVIVVAIDVQGAGTLEAADLVHEGVSARVAVFEDPPTESDREFIRRGLPYDDRAAISETQLHMLGVQNVERIPRSVSGSEQEGQILPSWCQKRGYRSAVLVVAADHSRPDRADHAACHPRSPGDDRSVVIALFQFQSG